MKYVKYICLVMTCLLAVFVLSSCSQSESRKVTYETQLSFSKAFAGTRTVKVTYPSTIVSPGSDKAETLDRLIRTNCPEVMKYTSDTSTGDVVYTFELAFSSFSDYNSKLASVLGSRPVVTFSDPDTVLTQGWRIEETFQSSQLFGWLTTAAHAEQISDYDTESEETNTTVIFAGSSTKSEPVISINKLTGYPIKKILIDTVNKKTVYDRTVTFQVSQKTFDSLGDKLTEYFKSITYPGTQIEWRVENNEYSYTVYFTDITAKQLEGYTNKLFSSVYGDASYVDKTVGSTALAYQNSFTETLDFSNYISDNNSDVPVEYRYSIKDNAQLDECRVYQNFEWVNSDSLLDDNDPGKLVAIGSKSSSLTLKINDGKQYIPRSIDITLTPLDGDQLKKTFSFVYDIAQGGTEACDYTANYFKGLGVQTEQIVKDGNKLCNIYFTGSPTELNSKIANIFGDSNLISASSYVPSMTLRTTRHIEDHVDMSDLLVGKNTDTPVTYTLIPNKGEQARSLSLIRTGASETLYGETNSDGNYTLKLGGTSGDFKADVSAANVSDIIVFCAISLIVVLIAVGLIFFLRSRKPGVMSLGAGEDPKKTLPGSGEKTPRKRLTSRNSGKKDGKK